MDYDKKFEELKQRLTLEEIAESFVFPGKKPTPEEHAEFVKLRMELWNSKTPEQRMKNRLLGLKYRMKHCMEGRKESMDITANFLRQYIDITNKKQKDLADDLSINPSTLSRILNEKERLTLALAYRLERHSGDLIPAIYWWKLAQKEIEQDIRNNPDAKLKEAKLVKNIVYRETA